MTDLGMYFQRQAEEKAARAEWEAASARYDNAQIKARLAEIKSQHDPLNTLMSERMSERERLYAAAFYVVVGRMPPKEPA
jgi:multidrug efflux pump subunit AcrA (membrane-fusion protein)